MRKGLGDAKQVFARVLGDMTLVCVVIDSARGSICKVFLEDDSLKKKTKKH